MLVVRVLNSRPVIAVILAAVAGLWGYLFCYVIPTLAQHWFAAVVSIGFGVLGMLPGLSMAAAHAYSLFTGRAWNPQPSTVCPCCGRPLRAEDGGVPPDAVPASPGGDD